MSFKSDRKRNRSWRDSYASHKPSNHSRNAHDSSPYKRHKPSHPHTNSPQNSNLFIKPSSDINLTLERDGNTLTDSLMTYNRHHHKNISLQRRILPIYKHRDEILYSVEQYKVSIVVGETGSGKTTQIPQYLYESGWTASTRMICCTQPRRISTVSIANRVAKEMNEPIGNTVGYAIRFYAKLSEKTRIKFMTVCCVFSSIYLFGF